MITIIIPEWLIWLAIGALSITIILQFTGLVLNIIAINVRLRLKKQNEILYDALKKVNDESR